MNITERMQQLAGVQISEAKKVSNEVKYLVGLYISARNGDNDTNKARKIKAILDKAIKKEGLNSQEALMVFGDPDASGSDALFDARMFITDEDNESLADKYSQFD